MTQKEARSCQSDPNRKRNPEGASGQEPVQPICSYSPISCELDGLRFCRQILGFSRVGSTNDVVRDLAGQGSIGPGTLVLADAQEAGRGRINHGWYSPPGQGIYASLYLEPMVDVANAVYVTLAAGLSVYEALGEWLGERSRKLDVKWPNDLLWEGRKLSGILVESSLQDNRMKYLVVGIGINISQSSFPEDIRNRAVSLFQITGDLISRHDLLLTVLRRLDANLHLLREGRLDVIRSNWEAASSFARGRKVKFFEHGRPIMGHTGGLQEDGALVILQRDGRRTAVYGGEIFEY